jgi:hypothetical protein
MADEITQTTDPTPAPEVAPGASPETPGNAGGLDLNALNTALSAHGRYNVTNVDDVVKIITSEQKAMREAQEKAAKHEQRLRRVEPLLTEAESNPEFQRYLYEKANEYADSGGANLDPNVASVLDPVMNRISSVEMQLAERSMQDQMESLKRDETFGPYVNDDVMKDLLIEARATGNYDLESHFTRKYGRQIIANVRAQAKQDVVREIQEKANAYPQGAAPQGQPAVPQQTPLAQMSDAEKAEYIKSEARRIMADTRYRDKVLSGG